MDRYLNANIILSKFCVSFAKLKKDLPIRPSEMGVLNIIVQRDGLFTPLMIVELLEVSKPMITAHISVLEKKGYIYKEYSKQDGRSFYVKPTEKAVELVRMTGEKMDGYFRQIEAELGGESFSELLKTLEHTTEILKNMEWE